MEIFASQRVQALGGYAFAEVDKEVEKLKAQGITPIDFGVGDPTIPTPELVRRACQEGVEKRQSAGYPSYIGAAEYRATVADWTKGRFGVDLDPEKEVTATVGSKEAVFNFAEGIVSPDDVVIIPTPGYPPYTRGTQFAEGTAYHVPIRPENGYLIDLEAIPADVCSRAKLMWVNYPNSPSGAVASLDYLKQVVEFGQKHDIIIASDEAYSEIYFGDEPPHTMLEASKDGVVVFQSLSKRSAMTCYRIGWVSGDERIIDIFKKVKTNIDSGTPTFIQDAAIAALSDETHVEESRAEYKLKRDILINAMTSVGLPDCTPEATIYIWQRVPQGMSSLDFATKLLAPDVAIVTTPGAWISDETADGLNPGEGFVRFALVPSVEQTKEAAEKLTNLKL